MEASKLTPERDAFSLSYEEFGKPDVFIHAMGAADLSPGHRALLEDGADVDVGRLQLGRDQQALVPEYCTEIVIVGRVRWIADTTMQGKDDVAWFHFDREAERNTSFWGRMAA